jgi:mono/diheme cytochrome c family protein
MVGEGIVPTVLLLCLLLLPGLAHADEPTITVTLGDDTRTFTRGELLVRPDATTIDVARDVTYRVLMTYRAVPIVWTGAEVASIRSEQWPYQVAKLVSQPSPAMRWPALAVDSALPSIDPVRAGQALFAVQCLTCHKLNGAGASDVGPDLNLPQNPTEYLTGSGAA